MISFVRSLTVKSWAILGVIVIVLLMLLSWRAGCAAAKTAKADARQAETVSKELDRVAEETPAIRQDQQEKEDAVEKLNGSGLRLPDGYGKSLERVRRGTSEPGDPR